MEAAVTALTAVVTPASLFATLAQVAPLVGVGLVVGFGLTIARHTISGIGKGKGKI